MGKRLFLTNEPIGNLQHRHQMHDITEMILSRSWVMTWMSAMLSSDRTSVVQSHPPRLRSRNAMFDCSHVVTTQSYDSTVKLNKSECDLILFKKPLLMCG